MPNNTKLLVRGDKAPEFIASTYDGSSISLSELKKAGTVVLVFIRSFS
jgi:peroxiredoxin